MSDLEDPARSRKRVLDPIDRVSEILFGLIMVLTFTRSLSVAESGHAEVKEMLIGALGCNLIWGIIDGVFYLMGCLAERGRGLILFRNVRQADPQTSLRIIEDALPAPVASVMKPAELEAMRERLKALSEPPARPRTKAEDWLGAAGVFFLVFLSTFPVVIPFLFMTDIQRALTASNAIAIVMLFLTGHLFGKITGYRPVWVGICMVVLGLVLVGAAIALGG
jgi:hypothetical protein